MPPDPPDATEDEAEELDDQGLATGEHVPWKRGVSPVHKRQDRPGPQR